MKSKPKIESIRALCRLSSEFATSGFSSELDVLFGKLHASVTHIKNMVITLLSNIVIILTLFLGVCLSIEHDLTVVVPPGRRECFNQHIKEGQTFDFEFQVSSLDYNWKQLQILANVRKCSELLFIRKKNFLGTK